MTRSWASCRPTDPRLVGTIEAVERELLVDGFVLRYRTDEPAPPTGASPDTPADDGAAITPVGVDGLPPGEGAFLLTTFWLLDAYLLIDRRPDAEALFAKLLALRNDVGLLAEEWGVDDSRMLGNFPQAFSHVGLLNAAFALTRDRSSTTHRMVRPRRGDQSVRPILRPRSRGANGSKMGPMAASARRSRSGGVVPAATRRSSLASNRARPSQSSGARGPTSSTHQNGSSGSKS